MSRDELTHRITELGKLAHESGFHGASGVLYAVAGSLRIGTDGELLDHVVPFSKKQLAEIEIRKANERRRLN